LIYLNLSELRIEPEIGFYRAKGYDDSDTHESSSKAISTGLGGYWLFHIGDFTPFVGLRYSKSSDEYINENPSSPKYQRYSDQLYFGPTLGGEYRFSKHFSLGADVGFCRYTSSFRRVDDTSDNTTTNKGYTTISRIKLRVFFF
jgi:hypothetical protein